MLIKKHDLESTYTVNRKYLDPDIFLWSYKLYVRTGCLLPTTKTVIFLSISSSRSYWWSRGIKCCCLLLSPQSEHDIHILRVLFLPVVFSLIPLLYSQSRIVRLFLGHRLLYKSYPSASFFTFTVDMLENLLGFSRCFFFVLLLSAADSILSSNFCKVFSCSVFSVFWLTYFKASETIPALVVMSSMNL